MAKFTPLKEIVAGVDHLTKTVFSLDAAEYKNLTRSPKKPTKPIFEGKKWDKAKRRYFKIYTFLAVRIGTSPADEPPDLFDRAIFAACNSAQKAGMTAITPAVIYRILVGNYNADNYPVAHNQIEMVMASIRKLAGMKIALKLTDVKAKLDYNLDDFSDIVELEPILPCRIERGALNNGTTDNLIIFEKPPTLDKISSDKKQFTTFESSLLDIGNKRHSRAIIAAKFYTATYIMETLSDRQQKAKAKFEKAKANGKKADPPLARKILYSTLLEKVGMTGASDYVKRQICGVANAVANNFNTAGKLDGIIIDCKTKDGFIEW